MRIAAIRGSVLAGAAFCVLFALPGAAAATAATDAHVPQGRHAGLMRWVLRWNRIALDASGLDHTPVSAGESRVFGHQLGPGRSSRALAIVHIAIFDTIVALEGGYRPYTRTARVAGDVSLQAALSVAAHDTLSALFPSQAGTFDARLLEDLRDVVRPAARRAGIDLGRRVANAILTLRASDGSAYPDATMGVDYLPGSGPGEWQADPVTGSTLVLGARWGEVAPFTFRDAAQFRVAPPPALTSADYAAAYAQVQRLGGDGVITPTERTPEQTQVGLFWAYDGTPALCAPPRLYNQIAIGIARQRGSGGIELARLLALVNVAMADAGMAIWESKYHYRFWRPVTGIRVDDGNPATAPDARFTPLGAPASNLAGPNFTPPFPAYPSGHAGFGGALFQTLRRFYGTDAIAFTFVSDELNGVTVDNEGAVRPLAPRRFRSLSQAEEENGQSRIYLGIHWAFDKTAGIAQGRQIANHVFNSTFLPERSGPHTGARP